MTIDPYSFCPCGNGKKFKFCKCVDQPQEYEKIVKLLEGGQGLAALERLTSLLQKTPNAAWILALRGETALALQETEMYAENSERFHALQPDNPLALTMKSIAVFLNGDAAEEAVRYLVDALAEARDSLPSLVPQAINVLLSDLARHNKLYLAGLWIALLQQLAENDQETARLSRAIPNTLARFPTQLTKAPVSDPCKERIAEVEALTSAFQHRQAVSKLTSILREYPQEERALQLLLESHLIFLDESGIKTTLGKLVECGKCEPSSFYQALAWALQGQDALLADQVNDFYVIESEEDFLMKMAGSDLVSEMHEQASEQIRNEFAMMLQEEVPPKTVYVLRDKAIAKSDAPVSEEASEIASHVALLMLFGKQTDKPSRLYVNFRGLPSDMQLWQELKAELPLGEQVECDLPTEMPYKFFLTRSRICEDGSSPTPIQESKKIAEDFLNYPIRELEGSPLEAAKDEAKKPLLEALMVNLECQQDIMLERQDFDQIYQQLGLEREKFDGSESGNPAQLVMQDVESLSDPELQQHFLLVHNLRFERAGFLAARELRKRSEITLEPALRAAMLSELLEAEPYDSATSLSLLQEMEACYAELEQSPGMIVMERVQRLIATGQEGEARQVFVKAINDYPGDPVLMTVLQRSQAGAQPGAEEIAGSAIMSRPPKQAAAEADSGLILPGQDGAGDDSGESKLWLPGS